MHVLTGEHAIAELDPPLRAIDPTVRLSPIGPDGELDGDVSDVEVLFRFFPGERFPLGALGGDALGRALARLPRLRWIHTGGAGADGLLIPEVLARDLVLTSSTGLNAVPVAETAVALLLALAKRLPAHLGDQRQRRWQRHQKLELDGMTVLIVGLGRIGTEVARRCAAFGMRVIGVRTRRGAEPGVERIVGPDGLMAALGEADWVVLTVALTDQTRGLIGRAAFEAMKPGAMLINVARGALVDEPALCDALRSGRVGGAALDVFTTEPLPQTSPLYDFPNVMLLPHNAASSPHTRRRALGLFVDNFRRFVSGAPMRNQIDSRRGY